MKNKVIYFDIDRTLIDSVRLRELTRGGMYREFNFVRDKINIIIDNYIRSLKHKNDFCREEMLMIINQKTGVNYDILKNAHDKEEFYVESLFDDVIDSLEKFKENNNILGIYSEGFEDYQTDKLVLSGIYKYFDEDKIIIENRKLQKKVVEKMGEAVVVDDNLEVIEYLQNFPKITPIWLNRIDERKHEKVRTVCSLREI